MMGIMKLIMMGICLCLVFFIGFINGFVFGVSIDIPDNITVGMSEESIRVMDEAIAVQKARTAQCEDDYIEWNKSSDNYKGPMVLVEPIRVIEERKSIDEVKHVCEVNDKDVWWACMDACFFDGDNNNIFDNKNAYQCYDYCISEYNAPEMHTTEYFCDENGICEEIERSIVIVE